MAVKPQLPTVEHPTPGAWRRWLEANHASSQGVWLKFAKKGSGQTTVNHPQALEEALCYGWIDGQLRPLDEQFYLIRFTPRRPRSTWSENNRVKATELIEQGRMRPAGLAQVEAAKADGRWDAAYPPQSRASVPDDFQRALDADPDAGAFFATLTGSARYAFLYRLHHVKGACKRAEVISRYVELLGQGKTL